MRVSIFRTAAVAASFLPGVFTAAALPQVDGVQSIADSLNASAQSLGLEINSIAYANAAFNGSAGANIAPTLDLSKAIGGAVSTFWQTAFDIEKKVCTIAFTVNPVTLAKAQAALIASIQAQVTVVSNLAGTLQATVNNIKTLAAAFTAAELAALAQFIAALNTAANATVEPLSALAAGGIALGLNSLTTSVADLQTSIFALATLSASFAAIVPQ